MGIAVRSRMKFVHCISTILTGHQHSPFFLCTFKSPSQNRFFPDSRFMLCRIRLESRKGNVSRPYCSLGLLLQSQTRPLSYLPSHMLRRTSLTRVSHLLVRWPPSRQPQVATKILAVWYLISNLYTIPNLNWESPSSRSASYFWCVRYLQQQFRGFMVRPKGKLTTCQVFHNNSTAGHSLCVLARFYFALPRTNDRHPTG